MLKTRIIPCLDVKDGRVVKGTNFVNLRDAGDPVEIAKIYSTDESPVFINGILDAVFKNYIKENKE